MKIIFLLVGLVVLFGSAQSQTKQNISYYYKGNKVSYPVSYDRIIVEYQPGLSITELKKTLSKILSIATDSIEQTLANKQLMIKANLNVSRNATTLLSRLKTMPGLLFARPAFKTPSGKLNSYGKEFIVKLKEGQPYTSLQKLMEKNSCRLVRKYPFENNIYILSAGKQSGYDGLAMANLFYETGLFEYAEPDKIVYNAQHNAPNDPLYNLQWGHNNTGSAAQYNGTAGADMKVQQAWDITMGSPNIKIGVIDEGVDLTHPDLQANLLQGYNGGTMTSNPGDGAPLNPDRAHGTNCAGIIAAVANNNIGIAGVAPNCKIIPAVIFEGNGTYMGDAAVAASFDYIRTQGADVISNSYGGGGSSNAIDDAIHRAVTLGRNGKGCLVLFASGNNNADGVLYPANNPEVISVGGVNMCSQRKTGNSCDGENWWGANYGSGLDLVAPCVKIATTDIQGSGGYNASAGVAGDYNNTFNGTSSACPNAAGVVALILSVDNNLTVAQATQILELSCDKLPLYSYSSIADPNQPYGTWNNKTGHGRVNAYAALQMAQSGLYCSVQISTPSYRYCNSPVLLSVNNPDNNATYEWFRNGTSVGNGISYSINSPGDYWVVITKGACSATSNTINIINSIAVTVSALPDSICSGGNSLLTASGIDNPESHCTTSYSIGTTEGDYISLVSIATTSLNNTTAGAASPFYTLYPSSGSTTASLSANTNYTMTVGGGTWQDCYIRGWIDYNQDGVFDSGESIGISGNVGSLTTDNISFTIPAGSINGTTSMRVRSSDGSAGHSADKACGNTNSGFGETEDYTITIIDGVQKFSYAWTETLTGSTLATNNTAQVNALNITKTTTYKVTATRANGCVAVDSITVNIRQINSTTSKSDATCFGSATGSLTVTPINGTGPYTYRIGTSGNYVASNTFTGLKAGLYRVSIIDANGCSGISSQVTIAQQPPITGTFNNTNASCFGTATGSITLTPTNGTAPYLYRFGTTGSYITSNTFSNLRAGNYRIYMQDVNGCIGNVVASITQPSKVTLTYTKTDLSCYGKNDGSITLTGFGGTAPHQYRLGTSGNYNLNYNFSNLKPGSFRAYIQDANGCNGGSVSIAILQSLDPCNPDGKVNNSIVNGASGKSVITISPNPTTNYFILHPLSGNKELITIRVYDVNGKVVYAEKRRLGNSLIFGQELIAGTYLVEVIQGGERNIIKVLKMRL